MIEEGTSRSIEAMRIDVYARISDACRVADLPPPYAVLVTDYGMTGVELRIDDERPEQVDAWAAFLRLGDAVDVVYEAETPKPWIGHKAEATDFAGGLWLGFDAVEVWCAVKDPEQVARLSALAVLGA